VNVPTHLLSTLSESTIAKPVPGCVLLSRWMELRAGVSWPKDLPQQDRHLSPSVGLGFEILLGTEEFLARPVTF
jgi:hypothetical protein